MNNLFNKKPNKVIVDELSFGKESVSRIIILSHKKTKLKLVVKSHKLGYKATANVYIYTDNKWTSIYSIPLHSITTPIINHNDDDDTIRNLMNDDCELLLNTAVQIIS